MHKSFVKTFISLSFLFLVISKASAEGIWFPTDKPNCQVWNPNPSSEETASWSGACLSGKAHGKGSLTVYDNGKKSRYYEGEFQNGKWLGEKGSITTYENGEQITFNQEELENGSFPNGS